MSSMPAPDHLPAAGTGLSPGEVERLRSDLAAIQLPRRLWWMIQLRLWWAIRMRSGWAIRMRSWWAIRMRAMFPLPFPSHTTPGGIRPAHSGSLQRATLAGAVSIGALLWLSLSGTIIESRQAMLPASGGPASGALSWSRHHAPLEAHGATSTAQLGMESLAFLGLPYLGVAGPASGNATQSSQWITAADGELLAVRLLD